MNKSLEPNFPTVCVREGRANLIVPDMGSYLDERGKYAPWKAPVFYNFEAAPTRDISVAISRQLPRGARVLDAMCGAGARGIRIAAESEISSVVLNDINRDALLLAQLSLKLNRLGSRIELQSVGASSLCAAEDFREGYDYVDVDPFGTVAPFVHPALIAVTNGGILGVSSTDGANLCGNRRDALKRIYFAFNRDRTCPRESGLRILLAHVITRASSMGLCAQPLISYHFRDYFRAHFRIFPSASAASRLTKQIGYRAACSCSGAYLDSQVCETCHSPSIAGPLWTGGIADPGYAAKLETGIAAEKGVMSNTSFRILRALVEEGAMPNPHMEVHSLIKGRGLEPPRLNKLLEALQSQGYVAARSHFGANAIRTTANEEEVRKIIMNLR